MLSFTKIPMFSHGKAAVSLLETLQDLPGSELQWQIFEFTGVGSPPPGFVTMPGFEEHLLNLPYGYTMPWRDLIVFASGLRQTWDCYIVGATMNKRASWEELKREIYDNCTFLVQAADSTYWSIGRLSDFPEKI